VRAAAGYTWLDPDGSWLGLPRNDIWHLNGAAEIPLSNRIGLALAAQYERSPLEDVTGGEVGAPALMLTFGTSFALTPGLSAALLIDEGVPPFGVVPDIGFRFLLGATLSRSRD
jgi:hypothetical protein